MELKNVGGAKHARAADDDVCHFFHVGSAMATNIGNVPLSALTYRMAGDDLRMRVVVMFDREPEFSTLIFDNPHRLVFDLPETRFGFDEKSLEARGLSPVYVMGWPEITVRASFSRCVVHLMSRTFR